MDQRYQRIFILIGQHRYADAESELRGLLSESPSESRAHAMLSMCIAENETRMDEALAEAHAAIAHEPNEALAHYSLALVQLKRKEYRIASQAIEEAIQLEPLDAMYWGMKSRCELANERFQGMLQAAQMGLQLDPENIECRNLLSLALERTGAVKSSLEQAIETLRMDPEDDDSHAMLGFALLHNGKHLEARHAFREALRLNPMNEPAREGMMQAISSRSVVFRAVHGFYSWLNRMSSQRQMLIIFGGWILMQVLGSLGRTHPAIGVISLPILLLYLTFAVLTWIATPLFQTFLRFHPFGKNLLRTPELRLSNLVAPCLLLSVVGGIYAFFQHDFLVASGVAFYWVMATVVAVCCFRASQSHGNLKYAAFGLSAVVLALPLWGLYQAVQVTSYLPFTTHWKTSLWCFIGLQILQNVISVKER
jgi:tetratricopeptide (TPR) repeat protein